MSKLGKFTREQLEQGKRFAKKAQTPGQAFITYTNSQYLLNGQDITGTIFIAAIDEASIVYKLFEEGGVTEIRRYNAITDKDPGRPDSHKDRDLWKTDKKGKRIDPWGKQLDLPLERLGDDGEFDGTIVLLQATTQLLKTAIGVAIERFIEDGGKKRFFVKLTTEVNPTNQYQTLPKLEILGESDNTTDIFFAEDGSVTANLAPKDGDAEIHPTDDNSDDDIPF